MPIGNLTSQIFCNIYLNEFDWFVYHVIKPLGYVRYGDDFVLWFSDKNTAVRARKRGIIFLHDRLKLTINSKHNIVQPADNKLAYLGVDVWPGGRRLQKRAKQKIQTKLTIKNISSYKALVAQHQPKRYSKRLAWSLLELLDQKY